MCFALLFRSHSAGAGLRRRVSIAVLPDRLLPPALQEAFRDADRWGCPENQPIHSLREGHQAHLCASTTCTMMSNSCGRAVPPCTKAWERNQRNSLSPLQAAGELGTAGSCSCCRGAGRNPPGPLLEGLPYCISCSAIDVFPEVGRSSYVVLPLFRPAFLPDPNDGSLYILGGKKKEGLMVSGGAAAHLSPLLPWAAAAVDP